jgi:hypothetical protein
MTMIESTCPCDLHNLWCGFTRAQYSWILIWWKLRLEERIQFVPGKAPVLFGDLPRRSNIEFECVVACEITHVN